MIIKEIKIKGFKNYKEEKIISFSNITKIVGDNSQGKTSIGEAITWALYGCNLQGNDKANKDLLNKESKEMSVNITFSFNTEELNIVRAKKGRNTFLTLNGEEITQTKLNTVLGIDKATFLNMFNLEHFINLGSTESRKFLISMLPKIKKEQVSKLLQEPFKSMVEEANFFNPNIYLKDLRDDIKELEKGIVFSEGSIDAKETDLRTITIPEKQEFDTLALEMAQMDLQFLISEKPQLYDISQLLQKKYTLEKKLSTIEKDIDGLNDVTSLVSEITELRGKIKYLENQKLKMAKLNVGDNCPTCGNSISEEHMTDMLSDIDSEIECSKDILECFNSTLRSLEDENKQLIQNKKNQILIQIEHLDIDKLKKENEVIQKQFEQNISDKKIKLENIIKLETEKLNTIKLNNNLIDINIEKKKEIESSITDMKVKIIEQQTEISNLNNKIKAIKEYNSKYNEIMLDYIKPFLDLVGIKLFKVSPSTGEIKDCFEITYNGKELKLLSNSEKIKVSLEFSNLFRHYTGYNIPIFLDNAESITKYSKPETQIIEAKVVEGQALQVSA